MSTMFSVLVSWENQVIATLGNQATESSEVAGTSYCEHCLGVTIKISLLLSQPSVLKPAGNATDRLFLATSKFPPACTVINFHFPALRPQGGRLQTPLLVFPL